MIEVILDQNQTDVFLNQARPVYAVREFSGADLSAYRALAREFAKRFQNDPIVIVRSEAAGFSINLFALALFIETYHLDAKLDAVVFQVENAHAATEAYKPYVALTIGLKYAMRLREQTPKMIFKEISLLNYLNLNIRQDYLAKKMFISLPGAEPAQKIVADNADEALVAIGIIKTLSLTHCNAAIEAELSLSDRPVCQSEEDLIQKVIDGVTPWIHG